MGRHRRDLSRELWIQHFDNLIKYIEDDPELQARLQLYFRRLTNSEEKSVKSDRALSKLNQMKTELGANWTRWKARIAQRVKGKQPNCINLSEDTLQQYASFIGSYPLNVEELLIKLPRLLRQKGIHDISFLLSQKVNRSQPQKIVVKKRPIRRTNTISNK